MDRKSELDVGVVGAGFNANFHLLALGQVRRVNVTGVCALQGAATLAATAGDLGLGDCKVYQSVFDLAMNVDVVCLFMPNSERVDVLRQIVNAKKSGAKVTGVIIEKPLARNMAEARDMVALIKEAGLLSAYFENQVHMPAVQCCREQLAACEKATGAPHLSRSKEEHGGPHSPWFWDPTLQGGGVLLDMGCHSVAVSRQTLTPLGEDPSYLQPVEVFMALSLQKWGLKDYCQELLERTGVDYTKTPAEDYVSGYVKFRNRKTGQTVRADVTDSWCYTAPGLLLWMEAIAGSYALTVNTLQSPAGIFISDRAASSVENMELALEKSQASRGNLIVQTNEADLYGYVREWIDARDAFLAGRDGLLDADYGLDILQILMAGYLSHETGKVINLTDNGTLAKLEDYIPLIQKGEGRKVLEVHAPCS